MTAVLAAEFGPDARPARGLVERARAAGDSWVVAEAGEDAAALRPMLRAAAAAGLGVVVRLRDTRALDGLDDAVGDAFGERSVPALRDRLLVVVDSERAGKRLRTDARWAPSAIDLDALPGGLMSLLRRIAPNYVRGTCACDDVVVEAAAWPADRVARLAESLRARGGRLWLAGVDPGSAAALAAGPAFGLLVRR